VCAPAPRAVRRLQVTAVYLLVRSKRGVPASTRVESLLSGPLFNALHKQAAEGGTNVFGKVMAVEGDMSLPGLGLSPAHARELAERVTHVVHCAADLSLDAHIQQAIRCARSCHKRCGADAVPLQLCSCSCCCDGGGGACARVTRNQPVACAAPAHPRAAVHPCLGTAACRCNYLSTQQLLVLAGQMTRLRSLVFASTYWCVARRCCCHLATLCGVGPDGCLWRSDGTHRHGTLHCRCCGGVSLHAG
jgi:hypothetical protein